MTDLELARATVADLAAASCVVNPGLDWAVATARGASGLPEMWIATNEGAGYIPPAVYLPRSAPLAAGLDPDFDARWFGWFNPAETVLRAIRDRGDVVSAIATTWVTRSELISDAVEDVAMGVAPSGGPTDADASRLTRRRSHRLETINPALFDALERTDAADVDDYCRELTQTVAFGGGPELSAAAQSVARTLASARWPSVEEWAVLRREYESARLLSGSQRPGLTGIEEPDAVVRYMADYAYCRRLEALLCWEAGTPADIVYAALAAGVVLPFVHGHGLSSGGGLRRCGDDSRIHRPERCLPILRRTGLHLTDSEGRRTESSRSARPCRRRDPGRLPYACGSLVLGEQHIARQAPHRLHFAVLIWPSVGLQEVVEPYFRWRCVRVVPRIPRQIRLSFPRYQTPIERTDVASLRNWQDGFHSAAQRSSHVLGAHDRPPQRRKLIDPGLEFGRRRIAVECDHVGVVQLNAGNCATAPRISPGAVPDAACQWLTRID